MVTADLDLSRLKIEKGTAGAEAPRRGSLRWAVGFSAIAGAVLLAGYVFSGRQPAVKDGGGVRSSPAAERTSSAPAAASAKASSLLSATGYVVAQRKAAVSSKATGRLKELRVKEGDAVERDQILGVLENDDLLALVRQQEAGLAAAKARVAFDEAELTNARLQRDRVLRLLKDHVGTQADLDEAQARFFKAEAELGVARSNVEVAQAGLEKAKVDVEYTLIRAPFSGTVLTKDADVGEIVAPFGSSTNARAALVTMADMDSLEVEADVSEANITKIEVGQRCTISLDSFPGKKYDGVVNSIVPTVDLAKATVLTKIRFVHKDQDVLPEMSAKVDFFSEER